MPRKKQEDGKKPKRSNGEGSFTKRKDGRTQGSIRIGKKRYTVYGDTRQEAYDKLQAKIEEVKSGVETKREEMTVGQYLLKYLEVRSVDYKIGVHQSVTYTLKRIMKALGDIPLQKLSLDDIQGWILALKTRGLKPQTIQDYYGYFHTALEHAVKTKLLLFNPCDGVVLPRIEKVKHSILSREQIKLLLEIFKGHWFYPIFILFLATGLRAGELLALHWEDIDFEAKVLHVRRNAVWITGKGYIEGTPKTKSSERDIALQPFALEMLHQQKIDQDEQRWLAGEHWKEHGLIFTRAWGDHIRHKSLSYALSSRLKKADMDQITVHGLRHTTASQLLSMRINPKVVQELLGHANIQTTFDLYGQVLPKEQEQALLELNDLYWGNPQEVIISESVAVKMAVNDEDWIEGVWREVAP